ncbi:hypothetical protein B7463_g11191, partial [Scytalidium lignicola]
MSLDLSGVVFITGAGGAVGRATALRFAHHGAKKIAGLDINPTALDGTASALNAVNPDVEFLAITADLTSEEAVASAIETVVSKFGAIHYAINNAGVGQLLLPTGETETKDFDRVMSINFKGVWVCEKYELEQMIKQEPRTISSSGSISERGAIINVSSVLGYMAMPNLGIYNSSKHAILGLMRSDALDYARKGIRVNAVCPGFIDTPLLLEETRKALRTTIDRIPQGRLALPEEVADSICFLASGLASHVTGVALPVDGGFTAVRHCMAANGYFMKGNTLELNAITLMPTRVLPFNLPLEEHIELPIYAPASEVEQGESSNVVVSCSKFRITIILIMCFLSVFVVAFDNIIVVIVILIITLELYSLSG